MIFSHLDGCDVFFAEAPRVLFLRGVPLTKVLLIFGELTWSETADKNLKSINMSERKKLTQEPIPHPPTLDNET